jgi:hypothetical protein
MKPSNEIARQLSDGLVHLLLTDLIPEFGRASKHFLAHPKDFDGWEPFDATNTDADEQYCGGAIDCVTAFEIPGADGSSAAGWSFIKLQKLDLKHWRGRLHTFPPHSYDLMYRSTYDDGRAGCGRLPIVRTADHVRMHPQYRDRVTAGEVLADFEQIAEGLLEPHLPLEQSFAALSTHRKRAYWNVYLGHPGTARSRLATDQRGVRAFFSDRDIGESGRRSALLHWVAGHWRRRRPPNEEDASWVREHVRGKREFSWNGLRGEVVPPSDASASLVRKAPQ